MPVLRRVIGDELRRRRTDQGRTLREVSAAARVSLGYLSEVERGQKEASSELLASICGALEVPLSVMLRSVSDEVAYHEAAARRPVAVVGGLPDRGSLSAARGRGTVASAA
ncbi:MAG TPA: helix-turn-helix transcriptional regulator [Candidatus Nanopelagicales bacterium]|nr:helix-turn-helix transcriptional regulator [Candidatus Nanopelagicales bacterium]